MEDMNNKIRKLDPASILKRLIPDASIQKSILTLLDEAIGKAKFIAPEAYGVTLLKNGFRLNVGQVEAIVLTND